MSDPLFIGLTTGGAFLLSFLLFTNPKNNNIQANRWLAAFVCTLALAMLEIFIHNLNLKQRHRLILDLIEAGRFLSAPTLYLSVVFFTKANQKTGIKTLWHFAIFFAVLLLKLPLILTGENFRFPNDISAKIVLTIFRVALPLQTIMYWLLSYRQLRRHQQNIKQIASLTEEIDLSWLLYFLYILAGIVLVWLNLAIFNFELLFPYTPFLYFLSIYFLAYFTLKQKEIYPFTNSDRQQLDLVIAINQDSKSEKQKRLSDTQTRVLSDKLANLMQVEKLYPDNELSLPVLARKMDITLHELSYLINEVHGENFFFFVNKYRIEEAKRLLLSEQFEKLNMLGIAYQAGFNSKTTFNTAFKKYTGQSPSEFILAAGK